MMKNNSGYEEFKKAVVEKVRSFIPEKYQVVDAVLETIHKVNYDADAVVIRMPNGVAPTIYLAQHFEDYENGSSLETVCKSIADDFMEAAGNIPDVDPAHDLRRTVFCELVNTEQNRGLLANVPHREFLDLSIVVRTLFGKTTDGTLSAVITNDILNNSGISEEELFACADRNTRDLFPARIATLNQAIMNMMTGDHTFPEEPAKLKEGELPLYVVTNSRMYGGAIEMTHMGVLRKISNLCGGCDLVIFPSSLHEVIIGAMEVWDMEGMAEMVYSINQSQVDVQDRLSNQVYQYHSESGEVTILSSCKEALV